MKKTISAVLITCAIANPSMAASSCRIGHVCTHPGAAASSSDNSRNIAIAAVGIAVIAIVIGLSASDHNHGQVQLVRF